MEADARARTKGLRDRVTRLEQTLEKLEMEAAELESTFADPELYTSDVDVAQITERYDAVRARRSKLEAQWAEATAALEAAEGAALR